MSVNFPIEVTAMPILAPVGDNMGISALARNIGATPSSRDLSKTKIYNKNIIFKILIMFNIQYNYFLVYFVTKKVIFKYSI